MATQRDVRTVEQVAKDLAAAHADNDNELTQIWWCPDDEEVRLIEVSDGLCGVSENAVYPFAFVPTAEVPYRSVVVLLSPEEAERVESGELNVPPWFSDRVEVFRRE